MKPWIRVIALPRKHDGLEAYELHLPGALFQAYVLDDGSASIRTMFSHYIHFNATMTAIEARFRVLRMALGAAQEAGLVPTHGFHDIVTMMLSAKTAALLEAKR
jgi:hypothetical protein